jgi:hypothetical protein
VGDDVSTGKLYGCLAATGNGRAYAWHAIQNFGGGFSLSTGTADILGTGPVAILQVVVLASADANKLNPVTEVPDILTAGSWSNGSLPAEIDYLNSWAPQPLETPITFLPQLSALPGDANGDGHVDINDLTIVLAHFDQSTWERGPGRLGWRQGNFSNGPSVDINVLTILLAHFGQTDGSSASAMAAAPEPPAVTLVLAAADAARQDAQTSAGSSRTQTEFWEFRDTDGVQKGKRGQDDLSRA